MMNVMKEAAKSTRVEMHHGERYIRNARATNTQKGMIRNREAGNENPQTLEKSIVRSIAVTNEAVLPKRATLE